MFKANAESNSAAGTRVATKSGRAGFSLERMAVSDVYEALLLVGVSRTLGAETTAGEAFGAPKRAGLDG